MTRMRAVLIVALCSVFFGCTTGQRQAEVIPLPPVRIAMKGYSFLPPTEEGWAIAGRSDDQIALGKQGTHPNESYLILTALVSKKGVSTRESLLEVVSKDMSIAPNGARYRNAHHDVSATIVGGALCAVYDGESEDHGAPARSGRKDPMILHVRQLVCVHPKMKDTLVSVGFSHRHYTENRDATFLVRAQSVFDSLEFSEH